MEPGGKPFPAGSCAEELTDWHPGLLVVVYDLSERGGETGSIAQVADHKVALELLSPVAR